MKISTGITQKQMDIIEKSIASMVPLIGPEIYNLPINIEHDLRKSPAYINNNGIWIRIDIAKKDSANVRVYLMHEIFHPVIANPAVMGNLNHDLVNLADDYHINYLIRKLFGPKYDVRKVAIPGVYNAHLGKMHPLKCAEAIMRREERKQKNTGKNLVFTGMCGCHGVTHSSIKNVVMHIRKTYKINEDSHGPLIVFDKVDERKYNEVIESVRKSLYLSRIHTDIDNLTLNLFMKAYLENPMSVPDVHGKLTTQQALVYCWNTKKIRHLTEGNEDEAMLAAATFIVKCEMHASLLLYKCASISETMDRTRKKLRSLLKAWKKKRKNKDPRRSGQIRLQMRKLKSLKDSLKRWSAKKPLHELLVTHPVYAHTRASFKTVSLSSKYQREMYQSTPKIVGVKSNETTKAIQWISNISANTLQRLIETRKSLEQTMGGLMSDEEPEDNQKKNKEEGRKGNTGKKAKEENQDIDDENIEEGEGEGEEIVQAGDDEERKTKPGKGQGQKRSVLEELLHMTPEESRLLSNVMDFVKEFETALHVRKSRKYDEFAPTANVIPSNGSELERIEPSELALLDNEYTKMIFYAKLANGSLTVHYPEESKRQPVAIKIDASGSMQGRRYEMACGFAIAMMKKLAQDKRGGVFIIFSSGVTNSVTLREKQPFHIVDFIRMLLYQTFGGTNFDAPLLRAYAVKKEERWKAMTSLLVTDGEGSVSPEAAAELRKQKGRHDWISVILTGSRANANIRGMEGLQDDAIRVEKNEMQISLTKIGNSLL